MCTVYGLFYFERWISDLNVEFRLFFLEHCASFFLVLYNRFFISKIISQCLNSLAIHIAMNSYIYSETSKNLNMDYIEILAYSK